MSKISIKIWTSKGIAVSCTAYADDQSNDDDSADSDDGGDN
jgi:hypothetical protein